MKKKFQKRLPPACTEGLDARERELFLKAFFTGEIQKSESKQIDEHDDKAEKKAENIQEVNEDECALFLDAINRGIIGITSLKSSPRPSVRIIRSKKRKFADASIDLHGMGEQDAILALLAFLKQEKIRGSKTLLVVHGKGTGILRNAVWAVLERHALVNDFQVAPSRFGGEGALIVRINRKMR
jgi:DNA-nicking Smr family endonuclease